jgi:hypothetical protein
MSTSSFAICKMSVLSGRDRNCAVWPKLHWASSLDRGNCADFLTLDRMKYIYANQLKSSLIFVFASEDSDDTIACDLQSHIWSFPFREISRMGRVITALIA